MSKDVPAEEEEHEEHGAVGDDDEDREYMQGTLPLLDVMFSHIGKKKKERWSN